MLYYVQVTRIRVFTQIFFISQCLRARFCCYFYFTDEQISSKKAELTDLPQVRKSEI